MKFKTFSPFISLVSLFVFFLTVDIFTSSLGKFLWSLLFLGFISTDLIYRFIESRIGEVDNQKNTRFLVSGMGLISYLLYQVRDYLDFPTLAGVAEKASSLPKIRDFLLLLIILSSLAFLIFTIVLEVSNQSVQVQNNLRIKRTLFCKIHFTVFSGLAPYLLL